ncbi:MAG TPA: EpsG family protein [Allosphingosinicella sp.]|jgi:hypothetical protein
MFPYWLLFGAFAAGALGTHPTLQQRRSLGLLWLGALLIVAMIGLRYEIGVDWGNYLVIWDNAAWASYQQLLSGYAGDPAFYSIVWLLRRGGAEFWVLNFLCALFFTWGLVKFANQQANPWLAVAVAVPYLVIVIAMSGIRQATAIGFVFLALTAFPEKRTLRFLIWVGIAATFHASAILVVPLAGLSFTKNRFQAVMLLLAMALGGAYLLGRTFTEYANDYITEGQLESSGTVFRLAMNVLPALLFFKYKNLMGLQEHEKTLWRNFSYLAFFCILLFVVVPSSTAVDRLLLYIYPLQMLVLSRLPMAATPKQGGRILLTSGILCYLAATLFVFLSYGVNAYAYIPYKMIPVFEG